MNELKFKTGKFVSGYKHYERKGEDGEMHVYAKVQKRKLALSNPNCCDWCDIDDKNNFVLFNSMKTLFHPIA